MTNLWRGKKKLELIGLSNWQLRIKLVTFSYFFINKKNRVKVIIIFMFKRKSFYVGKILEMCKNYLTTACHTCKKSEFNEALNTKSEIRR